MNLEDKNNIGENDISLFDEILDPEFEEILAEEMAKLNLNSLKKFQSFIETMYERY